MPTSFNLGFSDFAVQWLRAYNFGLEEEPLRSAVKHLKRCPLVQNFFHIAFPHEIDEIDRRMFDIRYQGRSELVRVQFYPFYLVDSNLGAGHQRTGSVAVNLLLDLSSGFGVFNVSLPQISPQGGHAYSVEEIGYLARQWQLPEDGNGRPQCLTIRLYGSNELVNLYVREVMNFYYLQTHTVLWKAIKSDYIPPLKDSADIEAWLKLSDENDPVGCAVLKELHRRGFTRSTFPTSFGPLIDVWGMEGIQPSDFDAEIFSNQYEAEIAWLCTDGQRTTFGEQVRNLRNTKHLGLYIWPNHALYINQHPQMLGIDRVNMRVTLYGCLDIEVTRILEIINLQSALLHAFDGFLDQQLEQVSALAGSDHDALIQLTEQRRKMSRSMRRLDFYNLFHTADWESLYVRLLEHPHLRLREAANLVDIKSTRLNEEIQQAIIVQDRTRHQQQQERELNVLRGLHNLGLANDVQSRALLTINFLVSATASLSITEVLAPWLTSITRARPSFPDAYPLLWIGVNVVVFLLIALILTRISFLIIRKESRIIELEGRLDLPLDISRLQSYSVQHPNLAYLHLNTDYLTGFIRIQKPFGALVFEFDRERIYRYSVFLQGRKLLNPELVLHLYVEEEIGLLRSNEVILDSKD
jgi:hypothetical protein